MKRLNHEKLIDAFSTDERMAFSIVYEQYWEDLFKYVIRVLPDEDESVDVLQEAFLTLWEVRRKIPGLKSIKSFLFIITRNLAFKRLRQKIKNQATLDYYVDRYTQPSDSVDKWFDIKELNSLLDSEIERLPLKMKEVFLLSRTQHLSYQEIANHLDISDKTVKKQIYYALKYLRSKIDEEYIPYLIVFLIYDLIY